MKRMKTIMLSAGIFGLAFLGNPLNAQGGMHGGGNGDGDGGGYMNDFEIVTVTGVVSIDETFNMDRYFLDTDDDGTADYQLNFGPPDYQPDSGATRPEDGDTVTVTGAAQQMMMLDYEMIIVYEIDGLQWFDPENGDGYGDCGHDGGGMNGDLELITTSGVVLVDVEYEYPRYYLDENGDSEADYRLNFGPPWYEPDSGAVRPEDGDTVTITGGLGNSMMDDLSVIMVYELNGLVWMDPTDMGGYGHNGNGGMGNHGGHGDNDGDGNMHPHWGDGGHGDFEDGWGMHFGHGHGHGPGDGDGHQFPDSLDVISVSGTAIVESHMGQDQYYLDEDGDGAEDYRLNFGPQDYDPGNGAQRPSPGDEITITGAFVEMNMGDMIIVFEINGLWWSDPGDFEDWGPMGSAGQNNISLVNCFPNPFNPQTTIQFVLGENSMIDAGIYNINGQLVKQIASGYHTAGDYSFTWNASDQPSGIYFVKIATASQVNVNRVMLLK